MYLVFIQLKFHRAPVGHKMEKNNRSKSTSKQLVPELVRVATCYGGAGKFCEMTHDSYGLTTRTVHVTSLYEWTKDAFISRRGDWHRGKSRQTSRCPKSGRIVQLITSEYAVEEREHHANLDARLHYCDAAEDQEIQIRLLRWVELLSHFFLLLRYFIKLDFRLNIIYSTIKYFKSVAQDLRFIRSEAKS